MAVPRKEAFIQVWGSVGTSWRRLDGDWQSVENAELYEQ